MTSCYREVRQKVNITFHPENDTVSYFQRRWWYFDQEHSDGTLQDNITQLNVVAVVSNLFLFFYIIKLM